jgi:hypothetical protein
MDETRDDSSPEPVDEARREFLQGVKRWSSAVATLALGGSFVALSAPTAAAWVNGAWVNTRAGWINGGGGGWVNRAGGWINGVGGWVNRAVGGSAGWVNHAGGSAGWVNRYGGGGAAWVNR